MVDQVFIPGREAEDALTQQVGQRVRDALRQPVAGEAAGELSREPFL